MTWIEIARAAGRETRETGSEAGPSGRRGQAVGRGVPAAWRESGILLHAEAVAGDPFWETAETVTVPALLEQPLACLGLERGADHAAGLAGERAPWMDAGSHTGPAGGEERPLVFSCQGARLVGILHGPAAPGTRGVVVLVGGPQYRVGSHRQFLSMARGLAADGIPVLRFDYRGMGDSDGESPGFEAAEPDLAAAIDALCQACPGVREVVIWGLCDAATAAALFAWRQPRVAGMVLANPWVHSEAGQARTYLKHYYRDRLASRDFWRKILRGGLAWRESLSGLGKQLRRASRPGPETGSLADRMAAGLGSFEGRVWVLLSGRDLTATEFQEEVRQSAHWQPLRAGPRITWQTLPEADHTFSRREWMERVTAWTREWVHLA